jgi:hypothetical protein
MIISFQQPSATRANTQQFTLLAHRSPTTTARALLEFPHGARTVRTVRPSRSKRRTSSALRTRPQKLQARRNASRTAR